MTEPQSPACPLFKVASVLWDKWSLMIMRNLIRIGPQRFQDFLESPEGISPTTLSNRLKSLQEGGLIARVVTDGHPPRTRYELTDLGRQAQPMMREIRAFGQRLQSIEKEGPAP